MRVKNLSTKEDFDSARISMTANTLLNDLAIILTRKIQSELMSAIMRANGIDERKDAIKFAPNFFHIREAILKTLSTYMDVLHVETTSYPTDERFSDEIIKNIKREELKKEAAILVQTMFERDDLFLKDEMSDDFQRWRLATKDIVVLKTGKLAEDAL